MVRAMYANYTGPLYNLQRASDNATTDIGVLSTGFANGAAQVAFCTTPVPTVCAPSNASLTSPAGETISNG